MLYSVIIIIPNFFATFLKHLARQLGDIVAEHDEHLTPSNNYDTLSLATFESVATNRVLGQWDWSRMSPHKRYAMTLTNIRRTQEGLWAEINFPETFISGIASGIDSSQDAEADELFIARSVHTYKTCFRLYIGDTKHKISNHTWDLITDYFNQFRLQAEVTHMDIRFKDYNNQLFLLGFNHNKLQLMSVQEYEEHLARLASDRAHGLAASRTVGHAAMDTTVLATPFTRAAETTELTELQTRHTRARAELTDLETRIASATITRPAANTGQQQQQVAPDLQDLETIAAIH